MKSFDDIIDGIRRVNDRPEGALPLHAPIFAGNERRYVMETIDSTFVSSVGAFVNRFEEMLQEITGAARAVATVNGTAALHMALLLVGVGQGDMVLTQPLSFVATANAIAHAGACPAFVDVDPDTMGLSPEALETFLREQCRRVAGEVRHQATGRRVAACVPMHTFGHPCRLEAIIAICDAWGIPVAEDAAESLGSSIGGRACGTLGQVAALSFNGNKICTCGGGGAILTNDAALADRAKHLTTTAKKAHRWAFEHDSVAWNYRLPNLNAALGCAQLERLEDFLAAKRALAGRYKALLAPTAMVFQDEPAGTAANFWLCAARLPDAHSRDAFLTASNDAGVMTRPAWNLLHTLPMYAACPRGELPVAAALAATVVNLPSGVLHLEPSVRP